MQKKAVLFKGTFLKASFSLQKITSGPAFSVVWYITFIILSQVSELQGGMEIHMRPYIQGCVGIQYVFQHLNMLKCLILFANIEGAWV